MNQIQLHMLDLLHLEPMNRSRIIEALNLNDGQFRWSSSWLLNKGFVKKRRVGKLLMLNITPDGCVELARHKKIEPTAPTIASSPFINTMKLPIYAPSKELAFFRNDGNKHIKSRGY